MAKALGVGGVFFKSHDNEKLASWYRQWLDFPLEENYSASFPPAQMPRGAFTVWGPFKASTSYFDPCDKDFMINLVVDDLDGALSQVKRGGAKIVGEIEAYDYGRFGWFLDPEGNKVELWQPTTPPVDTTTP